MHRPQQTERVTSLAKQGICLETFPSSRVGLSRRIWKKLANGDRRSYGRLKRFRPDLVVISQGHNSGGLEWANVCRAALIPYVLIVHCNSEHWWFLDRQVEEAAACYRGARKVFCVSRGNLELLRLQLGDPLPNAEIVWNPYKVSPDRLPAWPVENGVWRLACVARLDPAAKGQELLLQILGRPEWRARSVELSLYGEGLHELTLRRLASMLQLQQVHFRGQGVGHRGDLEAKSFACSSIAVRRTAAGANRGHVVWSTGGRNGRSWKFGSLRRQRNGLCGSGAYFVLPCRHP